MLRLQLPIPKMLLFLLFFILSQCCRTYLADVGTAAQYSSPYLPTACYGDNPAQFPSNNLFGAAGDGIWDNGTSCGREYLVKCISASPGTCINQTIRIMMVDHPMTSKSPPSVSGTTIVLSSHAFAAIANSPASSIVIEYQLYARPPRPPRSSGQPPQINAAAKKGVTVDTTTDAAPISSFNKSTNVMAKILIILTQISCCYNILYGHV